MTVHMKWTTDSLIAAFGDYQWRTRGVSDGTLRYCKRYVRMFLRDSLGDDPIDVRQLKPRDVINFVVSMSTRYGATTLPTISSAVRSFLRFLRVSGIFNTHIESAIPRTPRWRLSTLPRGLTDEQHRMLLGSLDDSTPHRRRDRAIVLCISGLGLRAAEVAGLCLHDIDWRAGSIHIRKRKTRRGAVLPLPYDVGEALVAYLRGGRPKTAARQVFVRHYRPSVGVPLTRSAICAVVTTAIRRASIEPPHRGPHALRHTLATRMVRRGASFREIADVLGHEGLSSTEIYAKVDLPSLATVALPWPEVTV